MQGNHLFQPSLCGCVLSHLPLMRWKIPGILGGKWPLLGQQCRLPLPWGLHPCLCALFSGLQAWRSVPRPPEMNKPASLKLVLVMRTYFADQKEPHWPCTPGLGRGLRLSFSALSLLHLWGGPSLFVAAGSALQLGNFNLSAKSTELIYPPKSSEPSLVSPKVAALSSSVS